MLWNHGVSTAKHRASTTVSLAGCARKPGRHRGRSLAFPHGGERAE